MIVIINGKEVERDVDYIERDGHGMPVQHPMLYGNEEALFAVDGSVIIVDVFNPEPDDLECKE